VQGAFDIEFSEAAAQPTLPSGFEDFSLPVEAPAISGRLSNRFRLSLLCLQSALMRFFSKLKGIRTAGEKAGQCRPLTRGV
jgi:hypothetical protein